LIDFAFYSSAKYVYFDENKPLFSTDSGNFGMMQLKKTFLSDKRIDTEPIKKNINVADWVFRYLEPYNSALFREASHLITKRMLNSEDRVLGKEEIIEYAAMRFDLMAWRM
jgi:hypothetical protein